MELWEISKFRSNILLPFSGLKEAMCFSERLVPIYNFIQR
jgi:hypothetical protein